jgi:hypothetical protein
MEIIVVPKYLSKRHGEQLSDPSEEELRAALEELSFRDSEHPDCWLSNEEGWSLAFHEEGLAVLENAETDEGPWHVRSVDAATALDMWRLLLRDDLESLKKRFPWEHGYG